MADNELDEQARLVVVNPIVLREYWQDPDKVLDRAIPRNGRFSVTYPSVGGRAAEQRRQLRCKIEQAIEKDRRLAEERRAHCGDCQLGRLITHNPKLRAEYFRSPGKVLARAIPRQGLLERLWPTPCHRTRILRARLGDAIEAIISSDPRLVSAREAYFEKNLFLDEALRNPQRTFDALMWLSVLAFTIGAALLLGAFAGALLGKDLPEKAVLGGLSGAGGAATTLVTVFLVSRETIRRASGDNAQMRLILTSFATAITHYRAISIKTSTDAQERNRRIREATTKAVMEIEDFVEPRKADEAVGAA